MSARWRWLLKVALIVALEMGLVLIWIWELRALGMEVNFL
jgi:hypothetical protein